VIRRRVVVHGRVQGVWFRETTRRAAECAGVSGWVRNRADGTVEAVLEGPEDAVSAVVGFCERGPRGARVDRVVVAVEACEGLDGFRVL
jgi:acylphosphatase